MVLSFLHLITWFTFRTLVLLFSIYRYVIQLYRKYYHHRDEKNHDDGKEASNETILWNRLMKFGLKINHASVAKFRETSRKQIPVLYPKLEDSWFGCAQNVEKIEKLRDSHWITMKGCKEMKKVMLFIHGGGFISGSSLGLDLQSTVYGIKDLNKKQKNNGNSITHVLSVEYRLSEDPKFYKTMDKNTLTSNLSDQLEDCLDCFKYLIEEKKVAAKDIIISGFSAGACHSTMLILKKLMNSQDERLWPLHSVALFSAPCDLANAVIKADKWKEENVLILNQGLVNLINRCVTIEEKKNYSILQTILEMEKQDELFYHKLLQTKWVINYSNHEELTPGNEFLSHLLESKSQQINPKQVAIVTENHQMHCYPIAQYVLSEGKRSMEKVLLEAIN